MNVNGSLLIIILLHFVIAGIITQTCYKKHKEPNNHSTKNIAKIKVIIAPCSTDDYNVSGMKYPDIVDCKRKLIIKTKITSSQELELENNVISVRDVIDFNTKRKLQLLHPLIIKIKQHDVFELYPLDPKKNINGLVTEEVINNENQNFTGCETNSPTPTCGYTYMEDSIIPFSEGFCCSCDPQVNKARQPYEISPSEDQHWSKLYGGTISDSDVGERKSRNTLNITAQEHIENDVEHQDDDVENDLDLECDYLTNITSDNEILPEIKVHFNESLNNKLEDIPVKNIIHITLSEERMKRQKLNENRQIRGRQKCNQQNINNPNEYYFESAHCLRFSELWYTAFKLGKPFVEDELSIKVYVEQAEFGSKEKYCLEDLTKQKIKIGSLHQNFTDENNTVIATYETIGVPSFSLNHVPSYILVPQHLPRELQHKYPQAAGGPEEYLIVEESKISLEGSECDKAGVGFEAFSRQPSRCNHKKQTCLKNQPIHFWQHDMKARKNGKKGRYFLDNFVKGVGPYPIVVNQSNSQRLLKLMYRQNYSKMIEVHVNADHITVIKKGSFGQISQVYTDAMEDSDIQINAVVMNLDIIAATFKLTLFNCTDEVTADTGDKNDIIPPQHGKTFYMTLSGVLSSEDTECELQAVNVYESVVATRRIILKKGHRCVCAWHCQCVCDVQHHLPCIPLSLEDYKKAGYLGQLPISIYRGYPIYVPILQCLVLVVLMLFLAGITKAIVGLCFPSVASWGQWILWPQRARALRRYYETRFFHHKVHYDAYDFPLHPENKTKNVRFLPWYTEFFVNCVFFIWAVKSILLYRCSNYRSCDSLTSSECEHLISGHYASKKYSSSKKNSDSSTTQSFSEESKNEWRSSDARCDDSQEIFADKYVNELIEANFVYRNMSRPVGGVIIIPGSPYSILGNFLRNSDGKFEFHPPPVFMQYFMMDRTPVPKPLKLNPQFFRAIYNTAEEVLLANEITINPQGVVINQK